MEIESVKLGNGWIRVQTLGTGVLTVLLTFPSDEGRKCLSWMQKIQAKAIYLIRKYVTYVARYTYTPLKQTVMYIFSP